MEIQENLNDCQISGVQSINIPLVWEKASPLLERALVYANGLYELQDIYQYLMYQKMQLWIVADEYEIHCAAVTEFRAFPRKKVCYVVLAAGELSPGWEGWVSTIEEWAYGEGAELIQAFGRPGWKRFIQKEGYQIACHLYSKELCLPEGTAH